jgi:hypothetical protein
MPPRVDLATVVGVGIIAGGLVDIYRSRTERDIFAAKIEDFKHITSKPKE